jgi:hypothetical protein
MSRSLINRLILVKLPVILLVAGCATQQYVPVPEVESAPFLERQVTRSQGPVQLTAAVPSAEETLALFGLDLYAQGIQPVWLSAENRGDRRIRIALRSLDDQYFSPLEVAWLNHGGYSKEGKAAMDRWFYEQQMPRYIAPGSTGSGFVFTHLTRGSKAFNVDVNQASDTFHFTFLLPIPGFTPDYMSVNFDELYSESEVVELDLDGLRATLNDYDCCSTDASGQKVGDPLNAVIVGTRVALRRALLRGDWLESEANSTDVALSRTHYYRGRPPDGTFHKTRPGSSERKELRVWMSPLLYDGKPVFVAQVSYDMSGSVGDGSFKDYRIDPDLDAARMFLMQDFWYSQSLEKWAFVTGVPESTIESPQQNFQGSTYFTDGMRVVLFVTETPVAMTDTEILFWERLNL